jgi:putative ABC transport system permease protein
MSSRWSRWRLYLRAWTPGADAGVDEEIGFHFDERIGRLLSEGRSLEDARAQAVAEFGDVRRVRASLRTIDQRIERRRQRSSWLSALASDLRYAARSLWRAPAFSIAAIGTLALGVGINSVIFGAIDAVLLRPMPYGVPGQLVALWENVGEPGRRQRATVSAATLKDIERQNTVFTGIAGFRLSPQNFTGGDTPQRISVERVTPNFFSVLDVAPTLGRGFVAEEDRPGKDRVAIVSHRFWRQLGADPSLLRTTIRLDDVPYQVVGILPAGFQAPNDFGRPEPAAIYVPLAIAPADLTPEAHGEHNLDAVARLKPGVTVAGAQGELDGIFAWLATTYPDTNATVTAGMAPLRDDVVRGVRTSLVVLLGAVGLLWLVACVNLANLLLVRAVGRQREVTIRVALGARRRHVIQLLVTHSTLVAMLGCAAGLLLGGGLSRVLLRFAPAGIPRLDSMGLELRTFGVLAALSLAAGILFGLFPAWRVSRPALGDALRSSERNLVSRSALRWRNALVVAEISMSLVLLTGSGLLLRSFVKLAGVDLGFTTSRVLTMNINLPSARYSTADARVRFFEDLARRVETVPGVEAVGFANRFPMRGGWSGSIRVGDKQEVVEVDLQAVSPAYFSTLGIPLLKGRGFSDTDRTGFPPVAVVNGAFVRTYFRDRDPIGQQIGRNPTSPKVTIVGVVGDVRRAGKAATVLPELYYPAAQTDLYPVQIADFAVRTEGDPRRVLPAVRAAVLAIDGNQPVGNVRTLDEVVDESIARRRFEMVLIALFAAVALALTIVGIYGVVSYSVAQRISEFGVRIALGASRADILGIVLRQAAVLIAIGLGLGLSGAYLLSRALTTLLFEIPPHDPATFAAVAALLTTVALVSSYLPARRAAAVEPIEALRAN